MLPGTKVSNKHLLPVYSDEGAVPMIFYPIRTLVKSNIHDILIISSREHCGHIIENLSDGSCFEADFTYKIQDLKNVKLGIASALKLARNFTNDEDFAVILGDNFFEDTFVDEFRQFSEKSQEAAIFLHEVNDPHRFGVAVQEGNRLTIEEKPCEPKSNLAVTGLYLYTKEVYQIADTLLPSKRGELEITDINNYYCDRGVMTVHTLHGFWSDMGTPTSMLRTQEFISNAQDRI
jgi:glucose-1-phosphate thymidylyltransferase